MEKISVVASLVLLELFLITSPTEGFVRDRRGYRSRYNIDLSDQELQSSPLSWRGLTKGIMDAKIKTEDNRKDAYDGEYLFKAPGTEDMLLRSMNKKDYNDAENTGPIRPIAEEPEEDSDILAGPDSITTQSSDTNNGGKRADGFAAKDGLMNGIYADIDNDINVDNTARITVIIPLSTKL